MTDLFTPIQLGDLTLPNRIIMAPLTRMRAGEGNVPTQLNATYYTQRASAGLIISEATQVSLQGRGYAHSPGIHTPEQIEGWRLVTDGVHDAGGRIFLQLWHAGRTSHPELQLNKGLPVAPSAIAAEGHAYTFNDGRPDMVAPRALETEEIPEIVEQFRQGAKNAMAAGFDGVEIHGANGYLIDEFIEDGSNKRSDRYGGSIENRTRFLLEVIEAVTGVWGSNKVGVRLSPSGENYTMSDSNRAGTFKYVVEALNSFDLAYFHLMEPNQWGRQTGLDASFFRPIYKGLLMVNGDYNREQGNAVLNSGNADLVSFGRTFIANPDLPERLAIDAPLNEPDPSAFYGGDETGYTDYPFMKKSIRVIARITVKPGSEDRVKSVLSNLVEPTRQESGCLHYELLQNDKDAKEFVLLEEWSDRAALDSHTAASHTKKAESEVEDWLQQVPPDVKIYQTIG